MSSSKLNILIPTVPPSAMLSRTLQSLSEAIIPRELERIIIVENGARGRAEQVVSSFQDKLPIRYSFSGPPNKSDALNHGVSQLNGGIALLFDDDIRFSTDTLVAYEHAIRRSSRESYFGGPFQVDYEVPPPPWLNQHLPISALGWQLDVEHKEDWLQSPSGQLVPHFLGFNMGAYVDDIKGVGGFDPRRGPGSGAQGQDTQIQIDLLKAGKLPAYVEKAKVWHWVPVERSTPRWAISRRRKVGVADGRKIERGRFTRIPAWLIGKTLLSAIKASYPFCSRQQRFESHIRFSYLLGMCRGALT